MRKLRRRNDPESRRYWAGVDQLAAEIKQLPDWMGGERRTATMSETTNHIRYVARVIRARGQPSNEMAHMLENAAERAETLEDQLSELASQHETAILKADALAAQLTEVTRECRVDVSEIRDGEENDGPLRSRDLFIEGAGVSVLVNATVSGLVTYAVSQQGKSIAHGSLVSKELAEASLAPLRAVKNSDQNLCPNCGGTGIVE